MRGNAALRDAVSAFRAGRKRLGRYPMTMHSEHHGHGLANNMAAQMALLAIAVAVLLVIAWYYVW